MVVREDHPQAALINHTSVAKNVFGCNKRAKIARLPTNSSMVQMSTGNIIMNTKKEQPMADK
jgi:hypothetical protein